MNTNQITSTIKQAKRLKAMAQAEKPQDPKLLKAIDEAGAALTAALLLVLERPEQKPPQPADKK